MKINLKINCDKKLNVFMCNLINKIKFNFLITLNSFYLTNLISLKCIQKLQNREHDIPKNRKIKKHLDWKSMLIVPCKKLKIKYYL